MANNNFKRFAGGIQVKYELPSDPTEGKVGEIYGNTTKNMLRICVSTSPLTWQDLFIWAGSEDYATLFWDNVNGKWAENSLLRINNNLVYTPDTAFGAELTIRAGSATDPFGAGGGLNLLVGEGDAGLGEINTNAKTIRNTNGTNAEFLLDAGEATTPGEKGSKLKLAAGAGGTGADQGDLEVSAFDLFLNATNLIKVSTKHDTAPVTSDSASLYYNSFWNRYEYYDGTNWKFIDLKGLNVVDLYDETEITLPATTATTIDNITIITGMVVAFTAIGSPGYYHATVDTGNITWREIPIGQAADGTFTLGDKIFIKYGDVYQLNEMYYTGSAWVANLLRGTVIDSTVHWDGTKWAENTGILTTETSIYRPDENTADANTPDALEILGANKTAGTGDGGDIVIQGGSSLGGLQGKVKFSGHLIDIDAKHTSDPTTTTAGNLYFNETLNKYRFFNGVFWYNIEGPRSLTVVNLKDDTTTALPSTIGVAISTFSQTGTTVTVDTTTNHGLSLDDPVKISEVDIDDWVVGTTYALDDIVEYDGITYISLQATNTGNQPDTSPLWWDVVGVEGSFIVSNVNSATQFEYEAPYSGAASGINGIAQTFTVDSEFPNNGDYVIFTAITTPPEDNNHIYRADISGVNVTWVKPSLGQSSSGDVVTGDGARIIDGTQSNDTTWFFDGISWIRGDIARGTEINSILNWSGTNWIEDTSFEMASSVLKGRDDAEADAVKAADLYIKGAEKTAGTGNGGDLFLEGGDSAGGVKGKVNISGEKIQFDIDLASDPAIQPDWDSGTTYALDDLVTYSGATYKSLQAGNLNKQPDSEPTWWVEAPEEENSFAQQVYYNTTINKFKYFDGTEWRPIGGELPTTVTFTDNTTDNVLLSVPVASFNMLQVDFSIKRGTAWERGTLWVTSDGSDASISATGSGIGDPDILFNADVNSGNLRILFDAQSNGDDGSIMYVTRDKWLHS